MYAVMLHAIRSPAPTTRRQTRPQLVQLLVLKEMVPPTKPRHMPAASRLASALYSSPELPWPSQLVLPLALSSLVRYRLQPPMHLQRPPMPAILVLEVCVCPPSLPSSDSVADRLIFNFLVVDSKTNNAQRTGSSEDAGSSPTSTGSTTTESGSASQIGVQFGVAGILGAVMAAFFL